MPERKAALAIGAHPDDVEFMMAGTLILLGQQGYDLHIMTVANGSCGTAECDREEIIELRRGEAQRAAAVIGATYHPGVVEDLEIFYEIDALRKVAAVVRQVAPEIILTHPPVDYMEDHTNACRLAVTAAFGRGMRNFVTEPPVAPIENDVFVYHANPHSGLGPLRDRVVAGEFIDVTGVVDQKEEMLRCHESQKNWLDVSQGMDSYLITMREICRDIAGRSGAPGMAYAEGFRRHLHMGRSATDRDRLKEVLGDLVVVNDEYERGLR